MHCCSNCSFTGNKASYAAAFAAENSAVVKLMSSDFYNNSASNNGAVGVETGTAQVSKLTVALVLAVLGYTCRVSRGILCFINTCGVHDVCGSTIRMMMKALHLLSEKGRCCSQVIAVLASMLHGNVQRNADTCYEISLLTASTCGASRTV